MAGKVFRKFNWVARRKFVWQVTQFTEDADEDHSEGPLIYPRKLGGKSEPLIKTQGNSQVPHLSGFSVSFFLCSQLLAPNIQQKHFLPSGYPQDSHRVSMIFINMEVGVRPRGRSSNMMIFPINYLTIQMSMTYIFDTSHWKQFKKKIISQPTFKITAIKERTRWYKNQRSIFSEY